MADGEEVEVEVDVRLVLQRNQKLSTINGEIIRGHISVYESENPYALIIMVDTDHNLEFRMDVLREDLAHQLREWLKGAEIRNPCAYISQRIERAMTKFIKFGETPMQEDLVLWILSRSEMSADPITGEGQIVFGGLAPSEYEPPPVYNEYADNVRAAVRSEAIGAYVCDRGIF